MVVADADVDEDMKVVAVVSAKEVEVKPPTGRTTAGGVEVDWLEVDKSDGDDVGDGIIEDEVGGGWFLFPWIEVSPFCGAAVADVEEDTLVNNVAWAGGRIAVCTISSVRRIRLERRPTYKCRNHATG